MKEKRVATEEDWKMAEKVHKLVLKKGLKEEEIAKELGITPAQVYGYYMGFNFGEKKPETSS